MMTMVTFLKIAVLCSKKPRSYVKFSIIYTFLDNTLF